MLTSLSIKNFALIDDITLELRDGLTIITGETGTGKSILLGALSLLLGNRADLSTVRNSGKKCVIEGVFAISDYRLQSFFEEQELDYEPETIIRREILPSGKSRAFINDSPVNLSILGSLGARLIDIHSQHDTISLGDTEYRFSVIDALAGNDLLLAEYRKNFQEFNQLKRDLETLQSQQKEANAVFDYNSFLLNELRNANLKPRVQNELEEQQQQLDNVEALKENLGEALELLQREEVGNLAGLHEIKIRLGRIQQFSSNYKSLYERVESVQLEMEDVLQEMEDAILEIEDDPETLALVNQRLHEIYNLQKKHGVSTVEELLEIQEELTEKIAITENADVAFSKLNVQMEKAKTKTSDLGEKLHKQRTKILPKFITSIEKILQELGMPEARLKFSLHTTQNFSHRGNDEMEWKLAANKGSEFNDLKKVASGGELSRITLAIKSILAEYSKLPTIIFDEIDTGVSGEIAQKMGNILRSMGKQMQVISITHLPQIAAKGKQHFKVFKESKNNKTETKIVQLNGEERILELAGMLGGNENHASAIIHAKALMENRKT